MSERVDSLVGLLEEAGVDLLLVTDLVNVRYLTGYTGSNGLAVIGPQTRTFITDFRYVSQSAEEVEPSFERVQAPQDLIDGLPDVLGSGSLRLGFDDSNTSMRAHAKLREVLAAEVQLVPAAGLVERLRAVKGPEEVERHRRRRRARRRRLRTSACGRADRPHRARAGACARIRYA